MRTAKGRARRLGPVEPRVDGAVVAVAAVEVEGDRGGDGGFVGQPPEAPRPLAQPAQAGGSRRGVAERLHRERQVGLGVERVAGAPQAAHQPGVVIGGHGQRRRVLGTAEVTEELVPDVGRVGRQHPPSASGFGQAAAEGALSLAEPLAAARPFRERAA